MADDEGSDDERTAGGSEESPVRDDPDAVDGSADAGDVDTAEDADDAEDVEDADTAEDADDAEGTDDADAADADAADADGSDDPYGFNSYDPYGFESHDAEDFDATAEDDADDESDEDGENDDSRADDGAGERPRAISNFERQRAEREDAAPAGPDDGGDTDETEDADDGGDTDETDDADDGGDSDDADDGGDVGDRMTPDPEFDPQPGPAEPTAEPENGGGALSAPEGDQELPLAVHIEEMVRRLAVVLGIVALVTLVVFPVADQLITYLWNYHIPGAPELPDRRPRLYGPLELILTEIKVASLAGVVLGLPVFVYESYRFMRPGLYPRERRYYLASVPTSLVLALVGLAFAHFVVLPAIFAYFTSYTTGTAVVAFGLKETFRLILLLMGYMAVVFQIPLFIMLAIMMNLVTRQWLQEKRLLFWGAFLGLSFFVSPDPTGMAPIIIAATMVVLFEGTLLLLRWTGN
jgi:sec-independent protein translocase protein TatC